MPYPITSGAIFEAAIESRLYGQQTITILSYKYIGSASTDGAALMDDILTVLSAADAPLDFYREAMSQDVKDITLYGQWVFPQRYRYVEGPVAPQDGLIETPAMGSNVAVAIHRFGEEATRHGSGTLHLPGVPRSAIVDSLVTEGFQILYQDFANSVAAVIPVGLTAEIRPVLYNRQNPAASVEVVDAVAKITQRTMRRRTVGVGS